MAVNDIWRVVNYVTYQDQTAYNVSHWRVVVENDGSLTAPDAASEFSIGPSAYYKDLITSAATYYGASAQMIKPTLGAIAFSANGAGIGTAGTKAAAGQLSGYFNMKSAAGGKRQTARKYIPFPDDADLSATDSTPTTGYMTRLGFLAGSFKNARTVPGAGYTVTLVPVIYHRDLGTWNDILTANAKQKWATQRRRGKFGRPNAPPF